MTSAARTRPTPADAQTPCRMLGSGLLVPAPQLPPKPAWQGMLAYVADLQKRSLRPAEPPFRRPWLEIGPGYCYGPAFGHFDIVHEVLDLVAESPDIARDQMLNQLDLQRPDGTIPFCWMGENPARTWVPPGQPMADRLAAAGTFPPLWPVGVDACLALQPDEELLTTAYAALTRLLGWFATNRQLPDGSYFYADIFNDHRWESGMDMGIRFAKPPAQPAGCVDATSHVSWCHQFAARWASQLGKDPGPHQQAAAEANAYIQRNLYCAETAWFHDAWTVGDPARRHWAFEGMWALVAGAASPAQAAAALTGSLLDPQRFNTPHPIATVAASDPAFELRMLCGPAWNSFTLWSTEACLRYGHAAGARELLEKSLDRTAIQFARTGTVWEFYHPFGGEPESLVRKPGRAIKGPSRDYLAHNPLRAMYRLWAGLTDAATPGTAA